MLRKILRELILIRKALKIMTLMKENDYKEEFGIVIRVHGMPEEGVLEKFIEKRVIRIKEKYPYAKIRIEVNG